MTSRGGISYVLAKRAKPHRRDEMRVTTAVVALILTAQGLRSLARRLDPRRARLEAAQWPPPPIPATPTDPSIKDWTGWAGIVPAGSLVKDSGKIYRNISGVPLTTAPSAMPGGATAWAHLWALVTPGGTPPTAPAWSATATYAVGDTVTKDGHRWSCLIAHGTERQGTWAPGVAPTVWSDLGPA